MKKIRIFKAQYNRLEGLPIDIDEKDGSIDPQLLEYALGSCPWIHKIRCCHEESELLKGLGYSVEPEFDISNFYINVKARVEKMSKATWRPRSVLNRYLEGLAWTSLKIGGVDDLYQAWLSCKSNEKEHVMFRSLYDSILRGVHGHSDELFRRTTLFENQVIGFTSYMIVGKTAHLLMNLSLGKSEGYSNIDEKLREYSGAIVFYDAMKSLEALGVETAYLGFGGPPKDKLNVFKRNNSDGESGLFIATIRQTDEVKEEPKETRNAFL